MLGRELMGQGSTIILVVGLAGLSVNADRHSDRSASLRHARWALNFMAMCFVCYLISQRLDRGVVKRIGRLLLGDTSWKPPYASNLEEALESLGGFFCCCPPGHSKSPEKISPCGATFTPQAGEGGAIAG